MLASDVDMENWNKDTITPMSKAWMPKLESSDIFLKEFVDF